MSADVIAALYVHPGGMYYDLPGVDPWDEARDARSYNGPHPVVAHPPCERWCRLAGFTEARFGYKRGDDGGCFAAALAAVRRHGGVLEHPAFSHAWDAHDLSVRPRGAGWWEDCHGGWSCYVEQGRYGHAAKKATWLYAVDCELPELRWGRKLDSEGGDVAWAFHRADQRKRRRVDARPVLGKSSVTPTSFRDVLIEMARSVYRVRAATQP